VIVTSSLRGESLFVKEIVLIVVIKMGEVVWVGEVNGKDVCIYWLGGIHKYLVSIDYGEEYLEFSKAKGEAILKFLRELEEG